MLVRISRSDDSGITDSEVSNERWAVGAESLAPMAALPAGRVAMRIHKKRRVAHEMAIWGSPNFFVADQFGFEGKLVLLQTGFQQKSQKKQLED